MNDASRDDDAVDTLLRKAHQTLADAEYLLEGDRADSAINRAYYAAFYAASAALLLKGEEPRSHAGVMTRFSFHFVRTGRIPVDIAQTLSHAQTDRNRADYDFYAVFDVEAAADLTRGVRHFVDAVQDVIERERR